MNKPAWDESREMLGMSMDQWRDFINKEAAQRPTRIADGYQRFIEKSNTRIDQIINQTLGESSDG